MEFFFIHLYYLLNLGVRKILKYPFGEIFIYKNYLIAYMNEGVTITANLNDVLIDIVKSYYPTNKFVYITHRVNSYAVDPSIYLKTSKIKNLVGFAVVFGSDFAINNIDIEKIFLKKPFEFFYDLDEAIKWANQLCLKTK